MSWLKAIIQAIVAAILDWWQRQRDKPNELEDAKTPDGVARRNADAYNEWLRHKNEDADPKK